MIVRRRTKEDIEFDRKFRELKKQQQNKSKKEIVKEIIDKNKSLRLIDKLNVIDFFGISGIYYLYNDKEIVYIGESSCVFSRISQHYKDNAKDFDSFQCFKYDGCDKLRKMQEAKLIKKHKPKLNLQHNDNYKI